MQKKMGEDYEIKVSNQVDVKIKITAMSFKLTETENIENLGRQTNFLNDSQMKVIKLFEYKRNGATMYIILNLDNNSYIELMMTQKVNIGWEKCNF